MSEKSNSSGTDSQKPTKFRRVVKVLLLLVAALFALYAVENWRGHRAWEQAKVELAAKGEVLDWAATIPKAVPDDQNMLKYPGVRELLIKDHLNVRPNKSSKILNTPAAPVPTNQPPPPAIRIAEITVLQPGSIPAPGETVFDLTAKGTNLPSLSLPRARGNRIWMGPQNNALAEKPLAQMPPIRVYVRASRVLTAAEIGKLFAGESRGTGLHNVRAEAGVGANQFYLLCATNGCVTIADYLAQTADQAAKYNVIREAAKRPQVRLDGEFRNPMHVPIPDFVVMRTAAQLSAQRAQCCLMLDRPAEALRELALIHDLRRVLESPSITLVSAMIDVAVMGLYSTVIEQGFADGLWQPAQLEAIDRQLAEINLPALYATAIRTGERNGMCRFIEISSMDDYTEIWGNEWWKEPWAITVAISPKGWMYQNMAAVARLYQPMLDSIDSKAIRVDPAKHDETVHLFSTTIKEYSPYTFVAAICFPNFMKASQAMARNQDRVHMVRLATALERHRLASGAYPDTLAALLPKYFAKLPHDVVNGQPFLYRRNADGGYALWSPGWDLKDNGGAIGPEGGFGYNNLDWVLEVAGRK